MRNILLIFALLMTACSGEILEDCPPFGVTSPASPIQFWPTDCDTYNEKEVCGIFPKCYCHKIVCGDTVQDQFTWPESVDMLLVAFDEDDNEVFSEEYLKTDIYATTEIELQFSNTDFGSGITGWSNFSGSGRSGAVGWAWFDSGMTRGVRAVYSAESNSDITKYLAAERPDSLLGWPPGTYTIEIRALNDSNLVSGTGDDLSLSVYGMMTPTTQTLLGSSVLSVPNNNTYYVREITFTTLQYWTDFAVAMDQLGGGGTFEITAYIDYIRITSYPPTEEIYAESLYDISFVPSEVDLCNIDVRLERQIMSSPTEAIYKSDCLEIRESHPCTSLIEYSNNRNFAGLVYTEGSPAPTFTIRVPVSFFHERFPQEDFAMELSTGIEKTSSVLKKQKQLDTNYLPYYMHEKLILIFMHQFVFIDNKYWAKEEEYQIVEGNKRHPLKMGRIFLTEKNFVQRATL